MVKNYVLDTSAILAFIHNEQGAETVESFINQARKKQVHVMISFVSWTEVYYILLRLKGNQMAKEIISLMNRLPVEKVHSNDILALSAGRLKANHRLSLADAFVAATAIEKKAILVHKDPEFVSLSKDLIMEILPYKK